MENGTDPQTAAAIFRETYPLDFELLDENDEPVLYIVDDVIGHNLTLVIRNISPLTLNLVSPDGNDVASADNFHFELRFRPGTLSASTLDQLSIAGEDWNWQHVQQSDGTDSVYLLHTADPLALAPDASHAITLQNVSAEAGIGARGTRAELRYQQLTTGTGDTVTGNRLQHVSIVNARGRRNIPLHVGFVGSNMILNNNTANSLALRITNALRSEAFTFNPETRLVLSFDADDTPDHRLDYALGTAAEVAAIEVTAAGWSVQAPAAESISPEWILTLDPDSGSVTLGPGQHIQIDLQNIITSHPNGHTNVYLHYENVSGYADGQFIAGIEKTPLVYREGNVGIGTGNPRGQLHIGDNDSSDNGIVIGNGNLRFASSANHWKVNAASGRLRFSTETDYDVGESEKVAIFPNGRLGIGTTTPRYPLAIRAQETQEGLISFENPAGQTKWHLEQNFTGSRPGLNFVETGVADGRLFIGAGGRVGIGTTVPTARLHVNNNDNPSVPALLLASPNDSSWQLRIHNLAQPFFQVGMRVGNDGFFYVTNRANLSNPQSARLDSSGTWTSPSDRRFKEEIQPVRGVLEKVMALQPVSYRFKGLDAERQPSIGFIAQDVETVFPHLVSGSEEKYLDYAGFGPLAIRALQEMKQEYDDRIARLEQTVERLLARLEGRGDERREGQG